MVINEHKCVAEMKFDLSNNVCSRILGLLNKPKLKSSHILTVESSLCLQGVIIYLQSHVATGWLTYFYDSQQWTEHALHMS